MKNLFGGDLESESVAGVAMTMVIAKNLHSDIIQFSYSNGI